MTLFSNFHGMKHFNHLFFPLLLLMLALPAQAQRLSIESFFEAVDDITASAQSTMRIDNNGVPCALVKVYLPVEGATFDGSNTVGSTAFHVNQYWVYLIEHSKKLFVNVPGYLPLEVSFADYDVPSLSSKTTYVLVLNTGGPVRVQQQYVQLQVTPKDALVELEGELLVVTDGVASKRVRLGNYKYRVTADGYHETEGTVSVYDSNAPTVLNVALNPAFGWLTIAEDASLVGARIYADNKVIGEGSLSNFRLQSGRHAISVIKEGFTPFSQTIMVGDGQNSVLNISLKKDAAEVSISVKENAEIWINEELKGSGFWSGQLASGEYIIESKLPGRQTMQKIVEVKPDGHQNIELDVPGYYYGSLDLNSFPVGASLSIDGQYIGQTPLVKNGLTAGDHQISLTKLDYKDYTQVVNVVADQITELSIDLIPEKEIQLPATNIQATQEELVIPEETDKLPVVEERQVISQKMSERNNHAVAMNTPNVYIDALFQMGSMMGFGAGIGGYYKRINSEADLVVGLSETAPIFWNGTSSATYSYTYKATYYGAKLGYLVPIGDRMGLTPQIGIGVTKINGSVDQKGTGVDPNIYKSYAVPMSLALRFNYAITRNLGISVCPEYSFAINKGGIYSSMANVDSTAKGFANGFNVKAGLVVSF